MQQQNNYTPQQTAEWYEARVGKFTSSEIWKLMGVKGLSKEAELQEGAKTYVMDKFKELTTGCAQEIKASALEWGKMTEPFAKQALVDSQQVRMWESEFIQHPTMAYYGGSPDGTIVKGIENNWTLIEELNIWIKENPELHKKHSFTVEIKCPFNTTEHYKNMLYARDAATMRAKYPELYWQLQSNMYLQETYNSIFATFDPRIVINPKNQYFEANLQRNDSDIQLMLMQLNKAWQYYIEIGESFGVDVESYFSPHQIPTNG